MRLQAQREGGVSSSAECALRGRSAISAAVCTRDRTESLERTLRSLFDQELPLAEVLVVDNAPLNDATRSLVESHFPAVRYLREPKPGLDIARNRALHAAGCDIVAFVDDDVVVDRGWSQSIMRVFAESETVGVCTGRVEALALETEAQRLFEANGGLFSPGNESLRLPVDAKRRLLGGRVPLIAWAVSVGSGCNLAVRRRVALELGGFDEALDTGPALPGGGDLDIIWRVLGAGFEVAYEPSALVFHDHRREMRAAHVQIAGHQRGLIAFLTKTVGESRGSVRAACLLFLGWRLVKPGFRMLRRWAGKDPLPVPFLLEMWRSCWAGLGAYRAARRALGQDQPGLGEVS